ncbi:starvation-inducible DNA-binding protein [Gemmobacter megaterium]|uniref:Starvation-inducible DNA-binding protein n=1 Tax=Gemmobacter megaterium TaxID=1086013 RepID=A0A1N7K3J5_9RHOB|nr:DNA starvation/stationary phase protection protein [Gemmobacter megaterium]GGE00246.1 DNA starvation/stationary phase protection protein [Gemmobacter megaterium]SIS56141.1 starvation-inducible DNA-binding protein [Gemmobacter megaterium]
MATTTDLKTKPRLATPSDLGNNAVKDISAALNRVLADLYALHFKTKNFHWHVSGPHFRDYHLMLDEQAAEIIGITDDVAERARKIGGPALKSLAQVIGTSGITENEADFVSPDKMLAELTDDNRALVAALRKAKATCDDHGDHASSAMIDEWIDAAERRVWFLFETNRPAMASGH